MGHTSSYSKEELREQPAGCGVEIGYGSTANCGDIQPDGEVWFCPECKKKFNQRLERLHRQD